MTKQQERDDFIIRLTRELPEVPVHQVQELARKLLRLSATLDRLACAQCNGDWPADGPWRQHRGALPVQEAPVLECSRCGKYWAPEYIVKGQAGKCKECLLRYRAFVLLAPYGIVPQFQGDPRGYVLRLKMPSGQSNTWAGDGVGVPA